MTNRFLYFNWNDMTWYDILSPDIIANKLSEESIRTRLSEELRNASWNEFGLNSEELMAYKGKRKKRKSWDHANFFFEKVCEKRTRKAKEQNEHEHENESRLRTEKYSYH